MIREKFVHAILDTIDKDRYDIESIKTIECLPFKQRKKILEAIYETEIHESLAYISEDKRTAFMNTIADYLSEYMLTDIIEQKDKVALNCFDDLKIMALQALQNDAIKEINMIIEDYIDDYIKADDYSDPYAAHGLNRWDFF